MNDEEDGKVGLLSPSDEDKRFMPEAILEEGDQIVNFDFLDKSIKLEASDHSYDHALGEDLVAGNFMDNMDSPPDGFEDSNSDIMMDDDSQIVIHMDITEPLTTLRSLLEEKVGQKLDDFGFSLQDSQSLEDHKNLVDQCVQGEGIVQINCELKVSMNYGKRINIVDVLKPAEEYVEILGNGEDDIDDLADGGDDQKVRWIVDSSFKKDQEKLGIPQDPAKWSVEHVRHWLMWAVRQFSLSGIELSEWAISGAELSKMTQDEFRARVTRDPFNSFWTHFELLRKCKIVAINPNRAELKNMKDDSGEDANVEFRKEVLPRQKPQEKVVRMSRIIKSHPLAMQTEDVYEREGYEDCDYQSPCLAGPVQLWQFLLELLTDKNHRNAIQWLDNEGEFKLINPELVAHLWGLRKNKPTMNYEKLSRALRYYYDGDMISKVHGKRFVYKFVCDLKQMMGYSAGELNALVKEAELKAKQKAKKRPANFFSNPIFVNDFITLLP